MISRETRFIILGVVAGAAVGGLAILLTRLREQRGDQPLATAVKQDLNWSELFSILAVAVTLARRIGQLVEAPPDPQAST
ncbi:MAG: hypothetical protein ABI874_03745 [Chloroflexota bacterium]